MYYLVVILSVAASAAFSNLVGEIGSEYFANYLVDNDPADLGVRAPGSGPAADDMTVGKDGQPTPVAAAEPKATRDGDKSALTAGMVVPVLFTGLVAANASSAEPVASSAPPVGAEPRSSAAATLPARPIQVASLRVSDGLTPMAALDQPAQQMPADPAAAAPGTPAAATPAPAAVAPAAAAKDPGTPDVPVGPIDPQAKAILDLARDTPYRKPDGTAFLPIATQRIFAMRWLVSHQTAVPVAFEIPGHVITNPGTGTSVPAPLTGIIEPVAGAFPYLGMRVHTGDVLAYLRPTMSASEQAQIQARVQQLVNLISLSEKQIERMQEVLFIRYRVNKIESLKVQMEGNRRELSALRDSLDRREALRATGDGVISHVGAIVGGQVAQGTIVFEMVDPRALWVEAAAYDPSIAADIRSATAQTSDGQALSLEFVGGGLVLDNQAIPLRFRVVDPPDRLSVGTPVTVLVRQSRTLEGIPVPAASVIRDGDGRSVVWERLTAETFIAHQVKAVRVAGNTMVVQSGLSDGARVVIDGATILNQVR